MKWRAFRAFSSGALHWRGCARSVARVGGTQAAERPTDRRVRERYESWLFVKGPRDERRLRCAGELRIETFFVVLLDCESPPLLYDDTQVARRGKRRARAKSKPCRRLLSAAVGVRLLVAAEAPPHPPPFASLSPRSRLAFASLAHQAVCLTQSAPWPTTVAHANSIDDKMLKLGFFAFALACVDTFPTSQPTLDVWTLNLSNLAEACLRSKHNRKRNIEKPESTFLMFCFATPSFAIDSFVYRKFRRPRAFSRLLLMLHNKRLYAHARARACNPSACVIWRPAFKKCCPRRHPHQTHIQTRRAFTRLKNEDH